MKLRLAFACVIGIIVGAIAVLLFGWQFLAQDSCLDAGGGWVEARSYCRGLT